MTGKGVSEASKTAFSSLPPCSAFGHARREGGEKRRASTLAFFNFQTARRLSQDAHHRPVFMSATGQAVSFLSFLPEGSVRNARRKTAFAAAR